MHITRYTAALILLLSHITDIECRVRLPLTQSITFIEPSQPVSQLHAAPHTTDYIPMNGQHYRTIQSVYSDDLQWSRPRQPIKSTFNLTSHNIHPNAYIYNEDGTYNIEYYQSLHNNHNSNQRKLQQSTYIGDTLTGCAGLDFFVSTNIGSQSFLMIVDTGSTTSAVAGSQCSSCNVSPLYTQSGTDTGQTAVNTYGDGSGFTGEVYTDSFGPVGTQAISLNFVSITQASSTFFSDSTCTGTTPHSGSSGTASNVNQGILGLGYPGLAVANTQAWFTQYWADATHTNEAKVFATQLCQNTGKLFIGGVEDTAYTGSFQYVPITAQNYYTVGLNAASVGGVNMAASGTAIIDTGTSQIVLGPTAYANAVNAIISNSAFQSYFPNVGSSFFTSTNCILPPSGVTETTLNNALPTMAFGLSAGGGGTVTLTVQPVSSYLQLWNTNGESYLCSGLGLGSSDSDPIILGYPLLNQFTTVFDQANSRVGFAQAANCGASGFTVFTAGSTGLSSSSTAIIGGVVGALAGVALLVGIYYCCCHNRKQVPVQQSLYITPATQTTTPTSRYLTQPLVAPVVRTGGVGYTLSGRSVSNNSPSSANSTSSNSVQYTQYFDDNGRPYYYNHSTRQSQWERPLNMA